MFRVFKYYYIDISRQEDVDGFILILPKGLYTEADLRLCEIRIEDAEDLRELESFDRFSVIFTRATSLIIILVCFLARQFQTKIVSTF